ncbi:MAG: M55 family metallopeptidase [Longimicrobiales bacterium]
MNHATLALVLAVALSSNAGAQDPAFANKRVPFEPGFRVFIVPDMEGMGSTVAQWEILAGNEGERYRGRSSTDYWDYYRRLVTQEVNAVIAGARSTGGRSFVVNEGHGGNLFANILPWELDPVAILIRGFPKPMVMVTGIDSTFGTMMFTGAHANAGSKGVMSHNFAFDTLSVNGKILNEIGINALIAGEMGVSVSLVAGDDVLVEETRRMLDNGFVGVVQKIAVGPNAAITFSPQRVQNMLRDSAAEAVRREQRGDFRPFTLPKPYRVHFKVRASYPEELLTGMAEVERRYNLQKVAPRSYDFVTSDARMIGYLLDAIESVVLR